MICIGIGANLTHEIYGSPRRTCGAALEMLDREGINIQYCSKWYNTTPVLSGPQCSHKGQPWYVNGVVSIDTSMGAHQLLKVLLEVEKNFGRIRSSTNAPRTLDLDIIYYNNKVLNEKDLKIPHPRMHKRAFVLYPLRDLAPNWQHPVKLIKINEMIDALPVDQLCREMPDANGLFGTEWIY